MKIKKIVEESEWEDSKYRTKEWEQSVNIVTWEHNYVTKQYIIVYNEKE